MRVRTRKTSAAIALVAASVIASAGLAGTARAAGQAPPNKAVQLTGVQLAAALLPGSMFPRGFRYDSSSAYNSGKRLESGKVRYHLATMSCARLNNVDGRSGFGETAIAVNAYSTLVNNYTAAAGAGFAQLVYQFAGANGAWSFWAGLRSIAARCPGWGLASVSSGTVRPTQRITVVPIRGAQAFQVDFSMTFKPLGSIHLETVVAVRGQDVFETDALGLGQALPASPSVRTLMGELITRILRAR